MGIDFNKVPFSIFINFMFASIEVCVLLRSCRPIWRVSGFLLSSIAVLIDVLMEPLSNQLDFWYWKNNVIPSSNYIDWFLVAILNQTIFSYLDYKSDMSSWSLGYITILILFFFSFYI